MKISLNVQTKHYIKALGRKGVALQQTAADTLNESAEIINENYRGNLKRDAKLRNKYALGSIKTFKANPVSKSGEPRPLNKINAITGVRKMKGGKTHFLAKAENGGTTRGAGNTRNKVPVPLKDSRINMEDSKAIAGPNRLTKNATQTLKIKGRPFGVKGDKSLRTGRNFTTKQRFAVLNKYHSRLDGNSDKIQEDLYKPFYFIDGNNDLAIFKFKGKRLLKLRSLKKSSVRRKPRPRFENAVKNMSPRKIQEKFVRNAQKKMY